MFTQVVASAGPLTGLLEAVATSIGAGIVVGGFVAGIKGVASRRSRADAEKSAVISGYIGGSFGLLLLALDIFGRRFV